MSATPAVPDIHAACWARIREHLGSADCQLDLASTLVRKFRWTRDYAERAVEEYRRFCFLAACSDHPVSPSAEVDEVWHLHLQYTRDYWERFCPQVLRMSLHHEPGGRSAAQDRRFREQYAQTLASYQQCFGPPPEAFWPGNARRFDALPRFRAVDTERMLVLRRPRLPRLGAAAVAVTLLAVLALGLAPSAFALPQDPLDWNGASFLKLYVALCVGALILGRVLRHVGGDARPAGPVSLSPYDAAYLAGGAPRVMDAAMADLMARGIAHWEPSSQTVQFSGPTSGLPAPLDAVAQQLRTTPEPARAVRTLDSMLGTLRQNLQLRGLMLDEEGARKRAQRATLPILVVLVLGVAKVGVGLARDRPVGILVFLCFLMLIAGFIYLRSGSRVTRAGEQALRRARVDHAAATRAPRSQDMAIAVALLGTTALASTAFAAYHEARQPRDTGSGGDGGGSSCSATGGDSSGGGDSGGDSGGSGCGGCGGGGGD